MGKANGQIEFNFPRFGKNNSHWKGGKILTSEGYVRFTGGLHRGLLEHRVVMRVFHKGYQVHHRNGVPWRNYPSNLKVYRALQHCQLSQKRMGKTRITIADITPKELRYILGKGIHVPSSLLAIIKESWDEVPV